MSVTETLFHFPGLAGGLPRKLAWISAALAGTVVLSATAVATTVEPDGPVRMSGLKVSGLSGYEVLDSVGARVGEVIRVDADYKGRTRYVRVALDQGGEVRMAAFRAYLDKPNRQVEMILPADLIIAEAETEMATNAEASSPSPSP